MSAAVTTDTERADATRVYVGNLKPKANEAHLTEAFSQFGAILNVWVARKPPGFAFIAFEHESAAKRAVHVYGGDRPLEILGKPVKVQLAGEKMKQGKDTIGTRSPMPSTTKPDDNDRNRDDHERSYRSGDRHVRRRSDSSSRRRRSRSRSTSPVSRARHSHRRHESPRRKSSYSRRTPSGSRSRSRSPSSTRRYRSRSRSSSLRRHRHRRASS